jgi:peptidoglycan/xylan/chitin deacetylase (PgdA/CDA1 family)
MGRAGARHGVRALACMMMVVVGLCGVPGMLGRVAAQDQSAPIRVPILAYHNIDYSGTAYAVTPELLDAEVRWLIQNGYTAITLEQFYEGAFDGGWLPPNPVVLTDDDGWTSAVTFAQILAAEGVVGNYFVNNYSPVTPDQILILAQNGPVEAHTVTHAHLTQLDYDGQLEEIADNISYLEGITGQHIRFLAWPWNEWNQTSIEAASASGIVAAFALGGKPCYVGSIDPYAVPRIMMEATDDLDTFVAKVTAW